MDNQIIDNLLDQPEQMGRIIKLALLGTAFAVICILFSAAFTWFQPDQLSLSERYFPTATHTSTPTAAFTATPHLAATQRAFQSTGTAVALQALATNAAGEWQEIFSEPFDNNDNNWYVDTQDDAYSKITFEIKNGTYRWDALAHQGFIYSVPLSARFVDDFSLSLEVGLGDHTGSNDYRIVFRQDFSGNFYYFGVDTDQMYSLFRYYNGEWSALIDRTSTILMRRDQPNKLTVIAEGDHFMLFINEQFVAEEYDDQIKRGTTGLAIEIFEPDQQGIFEFDNVVLRVP